MPHRERDDRVANHRSQLYIHVYNPLSKLFTRIHEYIHVYMIFLCREEIIYSFFVLDILFVSTSAQKVIRTFFFSFQKKKIERDDAVRKSSIFTPFFFLFERKKSSVTTLKESFLYLHFFFLFKRKK